jgi:hypothetical protein
MGLNDIYCDRCDVFGHEFNTDECHIHWTSVEAPFGRQMKALEGSIMKLGDIPSDLWARSEQSPTLENMAQLPPGTYVRLLHYTPWVDGMKSGNYFDIETLDGKYSGTQIHLGELCELEVLDKLALIDEEQDAPG